MQRKRSALDGIDVVHQRHCPARPKDSAARCKCSPSYRVQVWSPKEGRLVRKTFRDRASAITWRDDVRVAIRTGALRPEVRTTVKQAADALVAGMRSGAVRNRSGRPYKPSAIRSYERALRLHVLPRLGGYRLADVQRRDVQAFVESLAAEDLSASTIGNAVDPLRVIYRRAIEDDELTVDPTERLRLPADDAKVRPSVDVPTADALVCAAPAGDRSLWALAFYGSLRRGELRALRVSDVELRVADDDRLAGVVHVRRTWDDEEGEVAAKSKAGERDVPLMGPSAQLLNDHLREATRTGDDLVFGATATAPFDASTIQFRADRAWKAAGLPRMTPHAMRKSGYNFLRLAGVDRYALRRVFGHGGKTDSDALYGAVLGAELESIRQQADAYLEATS